MKVYFRPPEYNFESSDTSDIPRKLLFPNPKEILPRSWGFELGVKARSKEDAQCYALLQQDLFDLMEQVNQYLVNLEVNGRAIIFYHAQGVKVGGDAKKLKLPPYLFSFGLAIATGEGESVLRVYVKQGQKIKIECGLGISCLVIRDVIAKFDWKSGFSLEVAIVSNFRKIVKAFFENKREWWVNEYAFNIPFEEYLGENGPKD